MMRLFMSIVILAVIIMFVILPMMKRIRKGLKRGGEYIDKAFTEELGEEDEEKQKLKQNEEK